eukprot:4317894-Amphidinium_carterae.1
MNSHRGVGRPRALSGAHAVPERPAESTFTPLMFRTKPFTPAPQVPQDHSNKNWYFLLGMSVLVALVFPMLHFAPQGLLLSENHLDCSTLSYHALYDY